MRLVGCAERCCSGAVINTFISTSETKLYAQCSPWMPNPHFPEYPKRLRCIQARRRRLDGGFTRKKEQALEEEVVSRNIRDYLFVS